MKKGAIHLDWVISIGIFLLYILFFFVFITPFYKPDTQEGVIMLDILENNIRKDVFWNVTRMPVFIIDCHECIGSPGGEDFCLSFFPFANWDQNEITFTDDFNNPINTKFEISDNCGSDGLHPSNDVTDFTFSYDLDGQKKTFWIIQNDGWNYGNTGWSSGDCNNYNEIESFCNFLSYAEDGTGDYEYYYGLAERIFGVSVGKFSDLDYEEIKDKWNFPEGADFWIKINYLDEEKGELQPFGNENPYEQANVYVREWSDYILNEDGTKDAIKINMAVWR